MLLLGWAGAGKALGAGWAGREVLGRGSGPRERSPRAEGKSGPPGWLLGCFLGLGLIGFLLFPFIFYFPFQNKLNLFEFKPHSIK